MSKDPRPLSDVLSSGTLGQLTHEAQRRRKETAEIKRRLTPEEADHLLSASTGADGTLTLVMDSPAWAARMRYRSAALGAKVDIKAHPRR